MEGSADDSETPGSSEMADLDAGMSRLHLSSNKSLSLPPPPETAEEVMPPSQSSAATSDDASADAVSQVDQFLLDTLKNPSKRLAILRVEHDVVKFIRDPTQQQLEFQEIPNSYQRLILHRVAQHYHLQSHAIPYGNSYGILLCKTADSCAPPVRLADVPVNLPQEDSDLMPKVAIRQRPKHSQNISIDTHFSKTNYQKSFKVRQEEYDRARARIFNSNDSTTRTDSDPEDEVRLPDNLPDSSFAPARSDEKPPSGWSENYLHSCSDSSSSRRLNRTMIEKEPFVSRHSANSSGAISEDYDPDYDRSYDRYMPRFDPGFGLNASPFTSQPLYSPAVNYYTEFPQLRPDHTSQVPAFPLPHFSPPHLHGPRPLPPVYYGPPGSMIPEFSFSHVPDHPTASVCMQSSHFSVSPHPGMNSGYPNDQFQSSTQQPDASFQFSRPR